jgi:hypothetical protein
MPKEKRGESKKRDGYAGLVLAAIPAVALVCAALLHYTMQVFLDDNLWMRVVLIVWLPVYISIAVMGPPLLISLGIWYFIRREEMVFWVVLYVTTLTWGFWYLIPPIRANWGEFLIFVDWLSKT